MDHGKNRREQRSRMILAAAIGIAILAAVILGTATGLFRSIRQSGESSEPVTEEAAAGWTAAEKPADLTYDGKKYLYNDHLSNYLLLGVDSSGPIHEKKEPGKAGQSDFIFFISYDRVKKTSVGLSIPRETVTQIERFSPGGDSLGLATDFLTLQYAFGDGVEKSCRLTAEAVSRLMNGIPIQGYAAINLESIPQLTDLVGGVEVTVPDDTLAEKDPTFTKGSRVILDASNTSLFIRSRDTSTELSTMDRRERQKVFLSAFSDKLAQRQKEDPHTISAILETMKPEMITNISNDIFADLALAKRSGGVQTIPGNETHEGFYDLYRVDDAALYEMIVRLFYNEVQ